jgi:hypothetical protein
VSFLLLLCLGAVAFTQSLTDAQKVDQAIALVKSVGGLTDTGLTNQKNILTRLETLKGQFIVVEPTPDPEPPPPPPVYVTQTTFDAALAEITARIAKLEAAPTPTPTPEPTPTPTPTPVPPPAEVCGNGIDDDKDGQIDEGCTVIPPPPPSGEAHTYFDNLVARPDFYAGRSLRPKAGAAAGTPYDEKQLLSRNAGGLHASGSCPGSFIYDPALDAARAPIPAFQEPGICEGHPLTAPVAASTSGAPDKLLLTSSTSTYGPPGQRQVQVDDEIMEIRVCTTDEGGDGLRGYIAATGAVCVTRGQYGTTAAAHAVGVKPKTSTNQINNYLRLPLTTTDGNTYLVTWEARWSDSYLGIGKWDSGQKTFQFTSFGESKLLEPKLRFDAQIPGFDPATHVGTVLARPYNSINTGQATWPETNGNTMGAGPTSTDFLPQVGEFIIHPNRWTRWFVKIEQRANDWDLVSMWVADEATNPVQILDRVPMSVGKSLDAARQTLSSFWFEQANSNTAYKRGGVFDITAHFRNWVVLKNPGDVTPLLVKPVR